MALYLGMHFGKKKRRDRSVQILVIIKGFILSCNVSTCIKMLVSFCTADCTVKLKERSNSLVKNTPSDELMTINNRSQYSENSKNVSFKSQMSLSLSLTKLNNNLYTVWDNFL